MDIFTGHIGWIEAICGPMFSGKSEELIRRLRRAVVARKRVQVFKPVLDDRYSANEIVSHADSRMPSQAVNNAAEIMDHLDPRTQVVGIDEANFFGADLVKITGQLADSGKQIIIAGLDTDYMGRPFPPHAGPAGPGRVHHQDAGYLHAVRQSGQAHATAGGIRRVDCGGRYRDV